MKDSPKPIEQVLRDESLRIQDQPDPIHNDGPAIWDLVIDDMHDRDQEGRRRYGTPLQPFNGRDALVDAYQEALDLVVYLRQQIYERDRIRVRFLYAADTWGFVEDLGGGHYRVLEPSPEGLPANTILYKEGDPGVGIVYAVVYRPASCVTDGDA